MISPESRGDAATKWQLSVTVPPTSPDDAAAKRPLFDPAAKRQLVDPTDAAAKRQLVDPTAHLQHSDPSRRSGDQGADDQSAGDAMLRETMELHAEPATLGEAAASPNESPALSGIDREGRLAASAGMGVPRATAAAAAMAAAAAAAEQHRLKTDSGVWHCPRPLVRARLAVYAKSGTADPIEAVVLEMHHSYLRTMPTGCHTAVILEALTIRAPTPQARISVHDVMYHLRSQLRAAVEVTNGPPLHTLSDELALLEAARVNDLKTLRRLLAAGVNPNRRHLVSGVTPLIAAATYNRREVVRLLLQAGATGDVVSFDGASALHIAAQRRFPQVVRYLLMADSPLHLKDSQGRTPFEAAQFGDPTSGVNMGDDMLRETMELLTTHPAGAYIDLSSP